MEYLQYVDQSGSSSVSIYVLNLVISGIPSIHHLSLGFPEGTLKVLNLVISGIPSILKINGSRRRIDTEF